MKPSDWGNIVLKHVMYGSDFWALMKELDEYENDSTICAETKIFNRNRLVEAYKFDELFTLMVEETYAMHLRQSWTDAVFCKGTRHILPCFCLKKNNSVTTVWVHPRVEHLDIEHILVQEVIRKEIDRKKSITQLKPLVRKWF